MKSTGVVFSNQLHGLIGGSLMAGSAAAAKDKKAIGNQKANKFENSQIRSRSPMVRQK